MKILLDTNIIVYRESDNSSMPNIGNLYKIIDNNSMMQKYINPVIKNEILQSFKDEKRRILIGRLDSYNMLEKYSKNICEEILNKFVMVDKTVNDENDSLILTDVYTGKVDVLITEDKKIKEKALLLGIQKKVMNINEFIFMNQLEKKVNHNILDISKVKMGDLNINDEFFDGLKSSYPSFEIWFKKKKDEDAYCYFENGKLLALLFLKNEEIGDDNYKDIKPNMRISRKLKISTFKVDIKHKKIGERFMKIIFDQAIYSNVEEIYVTIFDDNDEKKNLIKYLEKFGFKYFGKKDGKELVYIRRMNKHFENEFPLKSYPYVNLDRDAFVVAIMPKYHTYLLPDSKLSREVYRNIHMPVEYAINKYYISASGFKAKPKIGDNIVFYRMKDDIIPAKYSSVITTLGIVTNIYSPNNIEQLLSIVKNKTVYTESEIKDYYTPRMKNTYVIEFAYVSTLENKLNLQECLNNGILFEPPRGVEYINKEQFAKIIELGGVDNSILI